MTVIYGVSLAVGVVSLLAWIAGTVVASSIDGRQRSSPEERFGRTGRLVVAMLCGFGIAGMSATYAGWGTALSTVGALVGSLFLGVVAVMLGPDRSD